MCVIEGVEVGVEVVGLGEALFFVRAEEMFGFGGEGEGDGVAEFPGLELGEGGGP